MQEEGLWVLVPACKWCGLSLCLHCQPCMMAWLMKCWEPW